MTTLGNRKGGGLFGGLLLLTTLIAAALLAGNAVAGTSAEGAGNVVATAKGSTISIYKTKGAKRPYMHISRFVSNEALAFLVKVRAVGWEKVYLPVRPNGSTGWVKDSDVNLSLNTFVVEISLGKHRITVWNGRRVILDAPAGVGRSTLPTPHGTYFLVDLMSQPDPNGAYGPYAFGLSAYSNVLQSFGGGPGEIGLHGTDFPQGLGTDVSHGCIRISNANITKLAHLLPLGTPVLITA